MPPTCTTPNETIGSVEFAYIPDRRYPAGCRPVVHHPVASVDVSRFGLIYAGAQKNIGPPVCLVIVREDLIGTPLDGTPTMFNYATHADNGRCTTRRRPTAGTSPAWCSSGSGKQGGGWRYGRDQPTQGDAACTTRSTVQLFMQQPGRPTCRSWMNVPFTLADAALDEAFLKGAKRRRSQDVEGHRSVGGMRASIYNPMPEAGVKALVDYMAEFERTHG